VIWYEGIDAIQTAFFKMFNSIKVEGKGFGNFMLAVALSIEQSFLSAVDAISAAFNEVKIGDLTEQLEAANEVADQIDKDRAEADRKYLEKATPQQRKGFEAGRKEAREQGGANFSPERLKALEIAKQISDLENKGAENADAAQSRKEQRERDIDNAFNGGDKKDALNIRPDLFQARGQLQQLVDQAKSEAEVKAAGGEVFGVKDPVKTQEERAAGVPAALAEKKFESFNTFQSAIAGRIGIGGDAKQDKQEKLLEKIGGGIDKTNALLEDGGGYD